MAEYIDREACHIAVEIMRQHLKELSRKSKINTN